MLHATLLHPVLVDPNLFKTSVHEPTSCSTASKATDALLNWQCWQLACHELLRAA